MTYYSGIYLMYEGNKSDADTTQQNQELVYVNSENALRYKTISGDYEYYYGSNISGGPETLTLDNVCDNGSTTDKSITVDGLKSTSDVNISGVDGQGHDISIYDNVNLNNKNILNVDELHGHETRQTIKLGDTIDLNGKSIYTGTSWISRNGTGGINILSNGAVYNDYETDYQTCEFHELGRYIDSTSQTMSDGFGGYIGFDVSGSGVINEKIGKIGFVRDGEDNEGKFIVKVGTDGDETGLTIDSNLKVSIPSGNLSVNGDLEVYNHAYFNNEYSNTVVASGCTIDWRLGNKQKLTLDDNCEATFVAPSGVSNLLLHVVQDASGEHSLTFANSIKWANGLTPSLTTSGNAEDILTFYYNESDYYGAASLNFS